MMAHELGTALTAIDGGSPPTLRVVKDLIRSIRRGDVPQERHRLEFKRAFSDDTRGWAELAKDVVAIANFGGGIVLFGIEGVMHLTYRPHDVGSGPRDRPGAERLDDSEEATEREGKIAVTPAMIAAGVSVLVDFEEFVRLGPTGEELLVRKIVEASLAAASANRPEKTPS